MAVEEIVKENTPKAEGEAQGVKYISLTEEELERLIKAAGREGAKKGVEAYERRKEKDKEDLSPCLSLLPMYSSFSSAAGNE